MTLTKASASRLERLFHEGFSIMDIAEVLASFDAQVRAPGVRVFMEQHDYDLVGVRQEGVVVGYAVREELGEGLCEEYLHPFGEHDLVQDSASLAHSIASLGINRRCFVTVLDKAAAIVTLSDLEKPPVRMYLFGMITIVEMAISQLIREQCSQGSWQERLTEARLEKARQLMQERSRRKEAIDLLDCLQFSDKAKILLKNQQLRRKLGFDSRKAGIKFFKELEALRNNLAHAQQIVPSGWDQIVDISSRLDRLLANLDDVAANQPPRA